MGISRCRCYHRAFAQAPWSRGETPVSTSPPRRPRAAFTERELRDALGEFATGVTVIATRTPEGGYTGFTANSFNSVSLDPPLVVWSLNRRATQLAAFENASSYSINVLTYAQLPLAQRFAEPRRNRFAGVAFHPGASGAPLLDGCSAWFECRHYSLTPAGDHVLFLGEILHLARALDESAMLTFHRGRFGST
jgi:flavin reductase (DIM6/NTAB) family NADH-FMN oxidoreductase RutF